MHLCNTVYNYMQISLASAALYFSLNKARFDRTGLNKKFLLNYIQSHSAPVLITVSPLLWIWILSVKTKRDSIAEYHASVRGAYLISYRMEMRGKQKLKFWVLTEKFLQLLSFYITKSGCICRFTLHKLVSLPHK